ncbi:MAG: hypothetical protein ACP5NR_04380 [Athalassotoga sp.]|uniref:hypothetical protein n=1 Tax=Athalassotoga sp. TaxID=2022597 RepID=UPI003D060C67
MRKIYVLLILISIIATLSFADNWLNAQTEIQKSFNSNSPGQNLQNQLLGSTNTNNSFLNLGSSVSLLDSNNIHDKGTYYLTVSISNSGTTTIEWTLPNNALPGNVNWWTTGSGQNFVSKIATSNTSNNISISIYIPAGTSPGTYNEVITLATGNPGQDSNVWECFIDLTIVYKAQSYIATATSYDASFCGVTGNVLTNSYTPFDGGVLLAKLAVQSNMSMITVEVSTGVNGGSLTSGISPSGLPNGMTLHYSNNYTENGNVLTLPIGSNPYSGELDIFASNSIASWATPGQTTIQFEFTIVPKGSY